MKFLYIAIAAVLQLSDLGVAPAPAQAQRSPDGVPTGLVRDPGGVLRTAGDGLVVKFSCTQASFLSPNEREAIAEGAPACAEGYSATMWFCIPNEAINSHERGIDLTAQGQPHCSNQFTAVRQPLFAPPTGPVLKGPVPRAPQVPDNAGGLNLVSNRTTSAKPMSFTQLPNYHYSQVQRFPEPPTSGASGRFTIEKPYLHTSFGAGAHSLAQLAVDTQDDLNDVEYGWIIDRNLNGDLNPHLFVIRKLNGNYNILPAIPNCYNNSACGYRSISPLIHVSDSLIPGEVHDFTIVHRPALGILSSGWHILYDTTDVGYYPDAIWQLSTTPFTQAAFIAWWGEVAEFLPDISTAVIPTSAMGNGRSPGQPAIDQDANLNASLLAATIYRIQYLSQAGVPVTAAPTTFLPEPQWYSGTLAGNVFNYGGPGAASNSAYIPSYTLETQVNLMQVREGTSQAIPTPLQTTPGFNAGAVAVSPDGKRVYIESLVPNGVWAFDTSPSGLPQNGKFYSGNFGSTGISSDFAGAAVSPDGSTLWLTAGNSCVFPFNTSSQTFGTCMRLDAGNTSAGALAVSSDGTTLFVGGLDEVSSIPLTTPPSNSLCGGPCGVLQFPGLGHVGSIAISPDQSHLYVIGVQNMFVVALSQIGKQGYTPMSVPAGTLPLIAVAVSPDSRTVYVANATNHYYSSSYHPPESGPSNVLVFDATGLETNPTAALTPKTPISLPSQPDAPIPTGLSMSADGSTLHVATTCWLVDGCTNDTLVEINTATMTATSVPLPGGITSGTVQTHTPVPSILSGNFAGGR